MFRRYILKLSIYTKFMGLYRHSVKFAAVFNMLNIAAVLTLHMYFGISYEISEW